MNSNDSETYELVKKLLKHVSEGSEFYKNKFSEANVNIDKINSLEGMHTH